jgi:hypothetical protein
LERSSFAVLKPKNRVDALASEALMLSMKYYLYLGDHPALRGVICVDEQGRVYRSDNMREVTDVKFPIFAHPCRNKREAVALMNAHMENSPAWERAELPTAEPLHGPQTAKDQKR